MKQFSRIGALVLLGSAQVLAALALFGSSAPAAESTPAPSYVRISRAFFEKPLHAQVKLSAPNSTASSNGSDSKTFDSEVEWIQYPPTTPAPQTNNSELGQVLADFRDFVACAEMSSLGESRLCFKVMADVSNLGVNDNEMTLRGVDTISTETALFPTGAQCSATASQNAAPTPSASTPGTTKTAADGGPPSRYKLQKATVSANSLELEFKYSDGCGPNVQLTLTQVP
ncbi:MAG: hypothetical protein ACJ763_17200 [Bdellovibrionia bacterium]